MDFQIIDPSEWPNWDSLLLNSGDHSFFHSASWARVLKVSYRYKPAYFVLTDRDRLSFLMPCMEVASILTGKRGVSLPFTDQCPSYALKPEIIPDAVHDAIRYGKLAGWKYIEWRDSQSFSEDDSPFESFYTHEVNLSRPEAELFASFEESNRRSIRKAIKQGVAITISRSPDSMESFYRLNCLTRKRHGLPPQPLSFFRSLCRHVISNDLGMVISASHDKKIIASAVFLHFGKHAIYKYGASDMAYQNLRPNNLIMWEALKNYGSRGFENVNLGRTEPENHGLLRYKRQWGATESQLRYYRYELKKGAFLKKAPRTRKLHEGIFSQTPVFILRLIGNLLYRHAG
jgi:hypothetical protein